MSRAAAPLGRSPRGRRARNTTGTNLSRTITGRFRRPRNRRKTDRISLADLRTASTIGRAFRFGLGLVMLAGLLMSAQFGWRCLAETQRFQVATIDVTGTHRADWSALEAFAGVRVGDSILSLDLEAVATGLRRHPWVKSAQVRRRLPDHVAIELVEHVPALLVSLGPVYLADADGELFKPLRAGDGLDLPFLSGLNPELLDSDPDLVREVVGDALALAAAAGFRDPDPDLGRLEEIHWSRHLGWSLVTRAVNKDGDSRGTPRRVHLGKDPVPRLDLAARVMRRLGSLGRDPAEIWVDSPKTPDRVHVRFTVPNSSLLAKAGTP